MKFRVIAVGPGRSFDGSSSFDLEPADFPNVETLCRGPE
jgi:hypothetical protein